MSIMKTFLVIEDEKFINQYISNSLEANGYKTYSALTGKEGLSQITSLCPDFIVLDLGLPDIDGLTIIEQTRSWSNIPIIIVSARDNEIDKVTALDMGADDYVTKPFNTNELMARIRTALRHTYNAIGITDYVHKELSISFEKHLTFLNGKPLHLTQIQYKNIIISC